MDTYRQLGKVKTKYQIMQVDNGFVVTTSVPGDDRTYIFLTMDQLIEHMHVFFCDRVRVEINR